MQIVFAVVFDDDDNDDNDDDDDGSQRQSQTVPNQVFLFSC